MRRLKIVRRPPIYPKSPGHLPCSSLTHPLPLPSRRPSVSFGGFGLSATSTDQDISLFYERMEDRYSGVGNAQRPIVTKGEGSVQNLGLSNRDMEFIQGIQLAKEHVADVYGVPEELMAGAQHPTFSNRNAAIKDFYANTVTQEWDLLASEMQEQFVPMLPRAYEGVVLRFDTEEIAEMQESLRRRRPSYVPRR